MENVSGIYLITCRPPGKRALYYVGQSIKIKRRIGQHKSALKNNRYDNKKLQHYWSFYGENYFTFELLEICHHENLDCFELWWLKQMIGHINCFNIGTEPAAPMRGRKFSDDHKRKISEKISGSNHYAFGKMLSVEHKLAISSGGRGLFRSDETKARISSANIGSKNSMFGMTGIKNVKSRPVEGKNPITGKIIQFESGTLAIKSGFRQDSISRACNGIIRQHKGLVWRFTDDQDQV